MPHPTPHIDSAVIIGGGIFGVSTAAQLTRMGVAVTLINDGPLANGASGRVAGVAEHRTAALPPVSSTSASWHGTVSRSI